MMIAVMFGIDTQANRAGARAGSNAPRVNAIGNVIALQIALESREILLLRLEREHLESVVDRMRE